VPWSISDVEHKKKGLTLAQKKRWVAIANSVLKDSGDDVKAIMIANSKCCESVENLDFTLLDQAQVAEDARDIELRNMYARAFFIPENRSVQIGDKRVDTWWDRSSRNFITMTLDLQGHQIGDCDTTGNSNDAAVAHMWAIQRLRKGTMKVTEAKLTLITDVVFNKQVESLKRNGYAYLFKGYSSTHKVDLEACLKQIADEIVKAFPNVSLNLGGYAYSPADKTLRKWNASDGDTLKISCFAEIFDWAEFDVLGALFELNPEDWIEQYMRKGEPADQAEHEGKMLVGERARSEDVRKVTRRMFEKGRLLI